MDICFVSMKSIDQWMKIFKNSQIQIEEGSVIKTGANGPIKSIYIRDPDNNLIKISNEIKNKRLILFELDWLIHVFW